MYLCALKTIGMTGQKTPTALGTEKIGKLLMQYAIPAIIAMTASSLYNMVDSIFIGHGVGAMAISGLTLTFPLMNLAAAFGSLVGVGAATLVSVKLGQKDYDTAQRVLGNVLVLNIIIGLAFTVLTLIFLDPILYFFGGSEATVATVVINTILDPIFIYGFGWGIQGAAIATITAQVIALLWQFKLFSNKDELLHFHKGIFRLKKKIVFDSLAIGMAPFLMNLAACFIVILINKGLKQHGGDLAIGAFGIVNRLVFLFVMIVMGLNQGMQPIAGYNFGAKQYPRVTQVLKITIYAATIVTTIGFLMGMFIPQLAVSIFTTHEELVNISAKGLRIVVMFFPIVGFQMVTSNFFQSIGMASKAIFLSISRQVLVLIPCLLILPRFYGQLGVWISMPISDLIASLIAGGMLWWQFRQFRKATA